MSLTVNGTSATQGVNYSEQTLPVNAQEVQEPLFNPELSETEINTLTLELAKLEGELAVLEAQRQEKVDYKKELEQQRAAILKQKAQIENQIKENETAIKQNNEIIKQNEEKIELVQKEIEELEKQYEAKNAEALTLNEKINERIAQIIKGSEENLKEQQEKIKTATDEAYAKVASGEITEDEVSQYINNQVGGGINGTNADFAAIYSMNQQLRVLTETTRSISNQISAKNSSLLSYQTNIAKAIATNQELANKNKPLNAQLKDLDSQVATIDKEVASVNKEIGAIDSKITNKKEEIANVKAELYGTETNVTTGQSVNTVEQNDKNTYTESVTGTTKIESSNPFLAISYDTNSFANMVDALDAMHKANEQSIENAKAIVEANNNAMKNIFAFV